MIKQLINLTKCEQLLQQYIDKKFTLRFVSSSNNLFKTSYYIFSTIKIRKLVWKNCYIYHANKKISRKGLQNYFILYSGEYIKNNNIIYCNPQEILKWIIFKEKDYYEKIYKKCLENINLDRYLDLDNTFYDFTEGNIIEIQKCLNFLSKDDELKSKIQRILNEINEDPKLQHFFIKNK